MAKKSRESDSGGLNFEETELTLGLPGETREQKAGTKRVFSETVDLNLGGSSGVESEDKICNGDQSENETSVAAKPPTAK